MNIKYSFDSKRSGIRFREFLQARLPLSLDRFKSRIEAVDVRTSEEERSGDALCRIQLELVPTGMVQVCGKGGTHYLAAADAIQKLKPMLTRSIEQRRNPRKTRRRRPLKREADAFVEV